MRAVFYGGTRGVLRTAMVPGPAGVVAPAPAPVVAPAPVPSPGRPSAVCRGRSRARGIQAVARRSRTVSDTGWRLVRLAQDALGLDARGRPVMRGLVGDGDGKGGGGGVCVIGSRREGRVLQWGA